MVNRSAGVAPDVNLGEHTSHMPRPSVNKVAHSGFEMQRRRHHNPKQECTMTCVCQKLK